jgi:coenzyme F420-0:L-glutamate ligase/coenzyme F420-1:gamma-L-glutamate ligase
MPPTLPPTLTISAVPGIPAIEPGDELAAILSDALAAAALAPRDSDVLVVSHKIVSKAEGRYVDLATVTPSPPALELAEATGKDARLVQVILSESSAVLRHRPGLIIVEHRRGFVMANAGIDQSNVSGGTPGERVLRLPENPDASAAALRAALQARCGVHLAVIVCDSVGRAWRNGVVGLAIGAAGLPSLLDLRGERDREGRELKVTTVGFADQIASAAELLMGEGAEGRPAVLVRGLSWSQPDAPVTALLRGPQEDLFR